MLNVHFPSFRFSVFSHLPAPLANTLPYRQITRHYRQITQGYQTVKLLAQSTGEFTREERRKRRAPKGGDY